MQYQNNIPPVHFAQDISIGIRVLLDAYNLLAFYCLSVLLLCTDFSQTMNVRLWIIFIRIFAYLRDSPFIAFDCCRIDWYYFSPDFFNSFSQCFCTWRLFFCNFSFCQFPIKFSIRFRSGLFSDQSSVVNLVQKFWTTFDRWHEVSSLQFLLQ